ncbi:MAG: tetratricopeptide repeat protein [Pseudomonadota bacterium]
MKLVILSFLLLPLAAASKEKVRASFIRQLQVFFLMLASCTSTWAGLPEAAEAMRRRDFATAIKEWTPLARSGDKMAQFYLGAMYLYGQGVPVNDREASIWIRKAAEQGVADAQYFLSVMYAEGRGVPRNESEATQWVRKAAEQGHKEAQHNAGHAYELGVGVEKDMRQAVIWYRKAAAQGNPMSQRRMADLVKK